MYKNNDEAIDLEAKRLLDNGIYTDLEKAYSEAEKIITEVRVEFKKKQEKNSSVLGLNQSNEHFQMMSSEVIFLIIIEINGEKNE
jgi:hypothetical protein